MTIKYFVSFAIDGEMGNCDYTTDKLISCMADVREMEQVIKNGFGLKDTGAVVVIILWRPFEFSKTPERLTPQVSGLIEVQP